MSSRQKREGVQDPSTRKCQSYIKARSVHRVQKPTVWGQDSLPKVFLLLAFDFHTHNDLVQEGETQWFLALAGKILSRPSSCLTQSLGDVETGFMVVLIMPVQQDSDLTAFMR